MDKKKTLFQSKKRHWNTFVRNHKKSGVFSDNNGIMVLATANYLGVILNIVPTSGDARTPFFLFLMMLSMQIQMEGQFSGWVFIKMKRIKV